jgi:hypothetical protein
MRVHQLSEPARSPCPPPWPPAVADDDKGSGSGSKEVTFGSNYSDTVPKSAMESVLKGYESKASKTVKVNTVDHNTFQENINRYLQGTPDDVFTWFAGYRMQFFASRAWPATSPTCGPPWAPASPTAEEGVDRLRTASSTSCRSTTTRGRSSTGRACSSRRGYTPSRRRWTSSRRCAAG